MKRKGSQTVPHQIEEEPAHEFYARICAIHPKSIQSATWIPLISSSENQQNKSSSLEVSVTSHNVVPADDDVCDDSMLKAKNPTGNNLGTFAQALHFASMKSNNKGSSKFKLNKSNKGFQILTKMGYRESEGGLGKYRQGRMIPIKIKPKLDCHGLGVDLKNTKSGNRQISENKVTKKVKVTTSHVSQQFSHDRQKERMARHLLRMDIDVQYEDMYLKLMR